MNNRITYKLTTMRKLSKYELNYIYLNMSWDDGFMRRWIHGRDHGVGMCLVYVGTELVCWAALQYRRWPNRGDATIAAWTMKEHRLQGYAKNAIARCLEKCRTNKGESISAYSRVTSKCLRKLGYKVDKCHG